MGEEGRFDENVHMGQLPSVCTSAGIVSCVMWHVKETTPYRVDTTLIPPQPYNHLREYSRWETGRGPLGIMVNKCENLYIRDENPSTYSHLGEIVCGSGVHVSIAINFRLPHSTSTTWTHEDADAACSEVTTKLQYGGCKIAEGQCVGG